MAAIITPSHQSGDGPVPARSLVANSGRCHTEPGGRFVTDVDIARLPGWVGTRQGRSFKLQEDQLNIVSDPAPLEFLDGAMAIGILSWVREDSGLAQDTARA
jgi:hypothetical protein